MSNKVFANHSPVVTTSFHLAAQPVVINEAMSSNLSTVQDDDKEYPDMIEIYNYSSELQNLSSYYLSDEKDNPTK